MALEWRHFRRVHQPRQDHQHKDLRPYLQLERSRSGFVWIMQSPCQTSENRGRERLSTSQKASRVLLIESVKYPISFMTDLGEIAHAGRGWIGNKLETVAVRERRHHRNRRRSRNCDHGCILHEASTHFVYRLIRAVPLDNPAPS